MKKKLTEKLSYKDLSYLRRLLVSTGLLLVSISGLLPHSTEAGFGITPPYIKNSSLTRASKYAQKIILVRSEGEGDLRGEAVIDVPGINSWFSVDKGTSFVFPKGEKQFPIVVTVTVPKDAEFINHRGAIRIKMAPEQGSRPGTVGISLGAQVDVDLTIIEKEIIDFKVHRVSVADLSEGRKFLWMDFPGKIRFTMQIENTGNVAASPSQVVFDLYQKDRLLESTKNSNKLEKVEPFETRIITAQLPTHLAKGSYQANFRIYKQELIAQEGILDLSILPYGTIPGDTGYGLLGLAIGDQLILLLIVAGVIAPVVLVLERKRHTRRVYT